ncbi:MAG: M48 family metallopeptidase [Verrucomicrobiota bacterium]
MAVDFFQAQDQARKKTKLLVCYFGLAVLGIIVALYGVLWFAGLGGSEERAARLNSSEVPFWDRDLFFYTSVGVLLVVGLGTLGRTSQLASGGGSQIAESLGGRLLNPGTRDPLERRLLNVIEEMSIASGVPMPKVYLMERERGINAFAAGFQPQDAVIGVTRGCLETLSRDELQGVMAHEFSHILHGDMRINLRLVGVLFGILMLAVIGRILLRAGLFSTGGSSRERGGGAAAFGLVGLVLYLIGYIGVFFGHLIKAAVSRQREFLADASAVQFTRNPSGIADALKKIGGLHFGSKLATPRAEEASHMLFGNGLSASFTQAFATHPPLPRRIRAIEPDWDGTFLPALPAPPAKSSPAAPPSPPPLPRSSTASSKGARAGRAEQAMAMVGQFGPVQMAAAEGLHAHLQEGALLDTAHEALGAKALLCGLLLDEKPSLQRRQSEQIAATLGEDLAEQAGEIGQALRRESSAAKFALVDLALPALREASADDYDQLLGLLQGLMEADRRIEPFEFALISVVKRHLDHHFGRVDSKRIAFRKWPATGEAGPVLLSTVALVGQVSEEFYAKIARGLGVAAERLPQETLSWERIHRAIDVFDRATPLLKKQILYACAQLVLSDDQVEDREYDFLRAIADSLGCPMPVQFS